ncbi:MAG: hypothetical protein D6730_20835, partial [Bacteroidetes bacterium]
MPSSMQAFRLPHFFCALAALLLFAACEQQPEETFTYEAVELFGADYLNAYSTPPVMFHVNVADEENRLYQGWLIDNRGNMYAYSLDRPTIVLADGMVTTSESSLQRLLGQSEKLADPVDLDVLVEQYKKNWQASTAAIKERAGQADARLTTTYLGYVLSYPESGTANANGCGGSGRQDATHFRQV